MAFNKESFEAQQLLDNKVFDRLYNERVESIKERWETSNTTEEREFAWQELRSLRELYDYIIGAATDIARPDHE